MKLKYQVEVLELTEVHEIPGAWTEEDFRNLLRHIEYNDVDAIPVEELADMAALALSDLEPLEGAAKLLEHRFGDQMTPGQCQNIAAELRDEKLWEEYSEISFHHELFLCAWLLHQAYSKVFPEPDIARVKIKAVSLNPNSGINLVKPTPSFVARLLNDGMNEHNTIHRLFDDNVKSDKFDEAKHIIWDIETEKVEQNSSTMTVYTSWNWIDELKGIHQFESTAFSDGQLQQ